MRFGLCDGGGGLPLSVLVSTAATTTDKQTAPTKREREPQQYKTEVTCHQVAVLERHSHSSESV